MARSYTVGDVLPFAAVVDNTAGTAATDGTVTCTVTRPDGTTDSPVTVTPIGTQYLLSYPTAGIPAGRYIGYWQSTGSEIAAHTQTFTVAPAAPVVTVDEMKRLLDWKATDGDDDELWTEVANAVGLIESIAGPITPRTVTAEAHDGGRSMLWLDYTPLIAVASVTEMYGFVQRTLTLQPVGQATDMFGYSIDDTREGRLTRRGVASMTLPFGSGGPATQSGSVLVTYTAGRQVPSENVRRAVKDAAKYFWTMRTASPNDYASPNYSPGPASTRGVPDALLARLRNILGVTELLPPALF